MRARVLALLLTLSVLMSPVCAAAAEDMPTLPTVYSSISSDLPVPLGLKERPETLVIFDTPEGRIADISMASDRGQVDVLAYYREALPALGWYAENPQVWRRKNELLTIRFADEGRTVVFHLQPLPPEVRARIKSAPNW